MTEQLTESETKDTTVVISREVSHPLKAVWNVLVTPTGMEALLGEGGQLGDKGDRWEAKDGRYGMTRSFHPLEQIRFSWHAGEGAPRTMVDLRLRAKDDSTTVLEIRHEHVGPDLDPAELETHWGTALEQIAAQAS
ncbi:MAG: SRPBCC domain-containing protein [Actinomycetia bacterium]|nr:SRPBCC domain-containing protein [Actinomycetes bacterium]